MTFHETCLGICKLKISIFISYQPIPFHGSLRFYFISCNLDTRKPERNYVIRSRSYSRRKTKSECFSEVLVHPRNMWGPYLKSQPFRGFLKRCKTKLCYNSFEFGRRERLHTIRRDVKETPECSLIAIMYEGYQIWSTRFLDVN